MQEQEKLSDVAAELDLRYRQAEIINSVKAPESEKFWLAEDKIGIWFLPALALAGHFWFVCFLDWYYGLGWKMAVHFTNQEALELSLTFTFLWVVFAPCIVVAMIGFCSFNGEWVMQRDRYIKQLEKAIEKANALSRRNEPYKGITMREYNDALLRQAKLAMGLEVPALEEFSRPPVVVPPNPHIITLEMLGVEREEIRGASCMMPRI